MLSELSELDLRGNDELPFPHQARRAAYRRGPSCCIGSVWPLPMLRPMHAAAEHASKGNTPRGAASSSGLGERRLVIVRWRLLAAHAASRRTPRAHGSILQSRAACLDPTAHHAASAAGTVCRTIPNRLTHLFRSHLLPAPLTSVPTYFRSYGPSLTPSTIRPVYTPSRSCAKRKHACRGRWVCACNAHTLAYAMQRASVAHYATPN